MSVEFETRILEIPGPIKYTDLDAGPYPQILVYGDVRYVPESILTEQTNELLQRIEGLEKEKSFYGYCIKNQASSMKQHREERNALHHENAQLHLALKEMEAECEPQQGMAQVPVEKYLKLKEQAERGDYWKKQFEELERAAATHADHARHFHERWLDDGWQHWYERTSLEKENQKLREDNENLKTLVGDACYVFGEIKRDAETELLDIENQMEQYQKEE